MSLLHAAGVKSTLLFSPTLMSGKRIRRSFRTPIEPENMTSKRFKELVRGPGPTLTRDFWCLQFRAAKRCRLLYEVSKICFRSSRGYPTPILSGYLGANWHRIYTSSRPNIIRHTSMTATIWPLRVALSKAFSIRSRYCLMKSRFPLLMTASKSRSKREMELAGLKLKRVSPMIAFFSAFLRDTADQSMGRCKCTLV